MTRIPIHPRILARLRNNVAARKGRLSRRQAETVSLFESALTKLLECDMPDDQRTRCIALYRHILNRLMGFDPERPPDRSVMIALAAELEATCNELVRVMQRREPVAKSGSASAPPEVPGASS